MLLAYRELALDKDAFVSFIKTSQLKKWDRYVGIYGTDSEKQVVEQKNLKYREKYMLHLKKTASDVDKISMGA